MDSFIISYLRYFSNRLLDMKNSPIYPTFLGFNGIYNDFIAFLINSFQKTGNSNCPEVYRLRRYRDYYLKERKLGRLFIKMYYATSPSLVKHFGNKKWFRKIFKSYLDKKLIKLENSGYSDSPYND